ncbi:MAG: polyamine ABC transporter substrate-binding protein [Pseudomonadota bacterium]
MAAALAGQAQAQQEEKVLNIYNWSDYIADDTIKNFEKETGIKVRYDVFDNNEILNSKLAAGKSGYDIVVPTAQWAKLQIDGKMLRKLDKSKLSNLSNLDPQIQAKLAKLDPGNEYLVDWLWGYTTVGINVGKVKAALGALPMPDNAWDLIFNPKYAAKLKSCGVSFLDSPSEVLPAVLQYLGKPAYSTSTADYTEAGKALGAIRPYVTLFSSSGYINDLANGAVCVALGWSGDINIARQRALDAKNGNQIEVLVPKTSAALIFDTMAIPADAPHPGNAHLWINYILRPQVHASLTNKVFYANPNTAAIKYVRKEIADSKTVFLPPADMQRMVAPEAVPADVRRSITRIYTKFKTGM